MTDVILLHSPRPVIIESPFEGGSPREESNVEYAKACMLDALVRGEAPFLSHLLYPHKLDDTIPIQRHWGILSGHAIGVCLSAWVLYLDRGLTGGMLDGINAAVKAGFRPARPGHMPDRPILFRSLESRTHYGKTSSIALEILLKDIANPALGIGCADRLIDYFRTIASIDWGLP